MKKERFQAINSPEAFFFMFSIIPFIAKWLEKAVRIQ